MLSPAHLQPRLAAAPLQPNFVWRSYLGGSVLRRFRGHPAGTDDHFPEDWLASTVLARNGEFSRPQEGLSRLDCQDAPLLTDSLRDHPEHWLGDPPREPGRLPVLWKLLDASVRLQFQAHPDRAFARTHLNSNAGKTECWYILNTRGDACVYLGFQKPPSPTDWGAIIREQRVVDMLECFERIPVQPGECYVVPAGTPHAIGAGVFMMELQEPSDWVVRCETVMAGQVFPPAACLMGLDLERCLEVFDYTPRPLSEVRARLQQHPRLVRRDGAFVEEEVISPAYHEYFRLHRLTGEGPAQWAGGELMLLLSLRGSGELGAGEFSAPVHAGQTWLLPARVPEWEWIAPEGGWEFLLARLPRTAHTLIS